MTQPTGVRAWTDHEVAQLMQLAYESGRTYEHQRIAEAWVDIDTTWRTAAAATYEDRVTARAANLAPSTPDWLTRSAQRERRHLQALIDIGAHHPPAYTTWRQVHAAVTETVWERVFWDLAPATQAELADIAPASYQYAQLRDLGRAA